MICLCRMQYNLCKQLNKNLIYICHLKFKQRCHTSFDLPDHVVELKGMNEQERQNSGKVCTRTYIYMHEVRRGTTWMSTGLLLLRVSLATWNVYLGSPFSYFKHLKLVWFDRYSPGNNGHWIAFPNLSTAIWFFGLPKRVVQGLWDHVEFVSDNTDSFTQTNERS